MTLRSRVAPLVVGFRAPAARALAVLASVLLTWQVSALLTRSDNKSEIGAWSVIFTAMFAIGTVTRWGCDTLAVRSTATDAALGRSMAKALLSLVVLFSIPGGAALGCLAYSRSGVSELTSRTEVALAVGLVLLALNLTVLSGSWLRALGYVASGALLELGAAPALTIAILGVYAQFELIDLAHVVGAYVVSAWVTAIAMFLWAVRELRRVPVRSTEWRVRHFWGEHRVQLARFMVTGLGFFLFSYLSILVFGAFGDDASAADYRNCYTLAGFVSMVPTMQSSYLTPRFAELFHHGQLSELRTLVWRSTRNASVVGIALALPLIVFPGEALRLIFGEPYVHAAPMLRILAACALALVALGPVYPLMTMTGLERSASRTIALAVVAGVVVMSIAFVSGGPTAVTAASVLPPLGFAVVGHISLRAFGIDSSLWRVPPRDALRESSASR